MVTDFNNGDSSASLLSFLVTDSLTIPLLQGWRQFHTNLLVFPSQTDFQLTVFTEL
jgi:hypothetical protein